LPGERENARNNARCRQARKTTSHGMDKINTWVGLPVEESMRMTEDRDKINIEKVCSWCGQPSDRGADHFPISYIKILL